MEINQERGITDMYVKKIKRKCGVRGCKNTVSFAISKTREMGNSIIACEECLMDALATIEEQNKPVVEVPTVEEETAVTEETPTVEEEKSKIQRRKS